MGKCASKQQHERQPQSYYHPEQYQQQIVNVYSKNKWNLDDSTISISEHSIFLLIENEGQSESKKRSSSMETKGTAMSFGFKKKLLPSHKKQSKSKEKQTENANRVGSISNTSHFNIDNTGHVGDNNGNSVESFDMISDKDSTGRSTPRLTPPKKESSGGPYRSTRFGFRKSNIIRPASTGITSTKISNYDNVANNNNNKVDVKPRSKSACSSNRTAITTASYDSQQRQPTLHQFKQQQLQSDAQKRRNSPKIDNESINVTSSSTTTSAVNNNNSSTQHPHKKITFQMQPNATNFNQNKPPSGKRSYTVINTELHTNEIVRPTPQAATTIVSKFTLHTSSLPKVQYPVPISLTPNYAMDTKNAKQVANNTRKGGFQAHREISADSGIGSISNSNGFDVRTSPQRSRHRPRNLEMVISGRHTFQVRDLTGDESLSDDNVISLTLPELPSAFNSTHQPANLSGLIRANRNVQQSSNSRIDLNTRQSSLNSMCSEIIEEEKVFRDNSITEKHSKNNGFSSNAYGYSSASNSIIGSNAGEAMAAKDGISVSSNDSSKENGNDNDINYQRQDYDDEISTITMTTDNKQSFLSSTTMPISQSELQQNVDENVNNLEQNAIDRRHEVQHLKFAALTAAVSDILLDDETSPSDSLISSTASDEIVSKKNKKKINDSIKEKEEKDIDEISPIFDIASPVSHGTPTHASHSFSLSDGDVGRDFLIDDEIADQPVLCFGENHASSNTQLHSIVDTPTLMDVGSSRSLAQINRISASNNSINNNNNSYAPQVKPRHSLLTRTESLDTLSPCESICSDDLMIDFECNSSIDSIDRITKSNHSGSGTGIHAFDESQLLVEFEQKGGGLFKDWSYLLKTSRNKSQDISVSQLPARSTRLLNRSRFQQGTFSNNGSESPRSFDSLNNRKTSSHTSLQFGRDSANGSPDDHLFMLDKTLRNSMIQDVQYCKQQLLQLRSILQDDEECLTRPASLNSFETNNGKFFNTSGGGLDTLLTSLECNERDNYSPSLSDDPKHDLVDLRRQVVYLQSQLDDKDRTIRIQQNLISKLEAEVDRAQCGEDQTNVEQFIETANTATQTDRVRPISMNFDGSTSNRSEDEDTASVHSIATNASSCSSSSSSTSKLISQIENKTNSVNNSNGIILKKTVSTVHTSHIGNGKSSSIMSVIKTNTVQDDIVKSPSKIQVKSVPTTPTLRQIPRVIRTVPTRNESTESNGRNGKYIRNILSDTPTIDTKTMNDDATQITKTPIKSRKLFNNLNVLKSNGFSVPVKSDEDF